MLPGTTKRVATLYGFSPRFKESRIRLLPATFVSRVVRSNALSVVTSCSRQHPAQLPANHGAEPRCSAAPGHAKAPPSCWSAYVHISSASSQEEQPLALAHPLRPYSDMDSLTHAPGLMSGRSMSDSLLPSVFEQAKARQVLALPWMSQCVRLGTCFRSALAHTDAPVAPFSASPLFASACAGMYRPSGADASFRSSDSSSASASADHLSPSLGVSAGCPFLRAGVIGRYDRDVLSNNDACKTSVSASYRCGTVSLAAPPRLADDALVTLKDGGGLDALKERWGDYYVAGYVLGAHAGALISSASNSTSITERLAVTVQLRLLFWTASHTESTSRVTASSSSSASVSAFSTLQNASMRETADMDGPELQSLAAKANTMLANVSTVPTHVETKLGELGVHADSALGYEACDSLCNSGLVVELVLLPIETLREVQLWATSTDVI